MHFQVFDADMLLHMVLLPKILTIFCLSMEIWLIYFNINIVQSCGMITEFTIPKLTFWNTDYFNLIIFNKQKILKEILTFSLYLSRGVLIEKSTSEWQS